MRVADYSFARPADYGVLAASVDGVMRYTSNGSTGKEITRDEANLLKVHGIPIGITWEDRANSMLGGAAAGRVAAISSQSQTHAANVPDGVTYYACDFDATLNGPPTSPAALSNMHQIADFLSGAAQATDWEQVGCYGDLYVLQWLGANTPVRAGWQTGSMSHGTWNNWRWSGPLAPIAGFVQDEFWVEGQHPITISGCPVDLSTVTGNWYPRTAPSNGDISMADAASLALEIQDMANLISGEFSNVQAKLDWNIKAEGARFDALTAALQVMHGAIIDGAEGKPVDFNALAKVLEGAQFTLSKIQEGAPA